MVRSENKTSAIHFIITGGTIDSHYEGKSGTVVVNKKSVVPKFIRSLKLHDAVKFTEVCMKDSRTLDAKDLKNILKAVESSPSKKIIITHGTYTMVKTAKYLKAKLKQKDKTAILTGAMVPLKDRLKSDGPFNLEYAVAKVQQLPAGVFVCMNGKVFSANEVKKDVTKGVFVKIRVR